MHPRRRTRGSYKLAAHYVSTGVDAAGKEGRDEGKGKQEDMSRRKGRLSGRINLRDLSSIYGGDVGCEGPAQKTIEARVYGLAWPNRLKLRSAMLYFSPFCCCCCCCCVVVVVDVAAAAAVIGWLLRKVW
jgi:hypothetical protein